MRKKEKIYMVKIKMIELNYKDIKREYRYAVTDTGR